MVQGVDLGVVAGDWVGMQCDSSVDVTAMHRTCNGTDTREHGQRFVLHPHQSSGYPHALFVYDSGRPYMLAGK